MREWLVQIRKIKGFSKKQIADKSNISDVFYHYIETGERNPSVDTAKKIAETLDFDWTIFYKEETA